MWRYLHIAKEKQRLFFSVCVTWKTEKHLVYILWLLVGLHCPYDSEILQLLFFINEYENNIIGIHIVFLHLHCLD